MRSDGCKQSRSGCVLGMLVALGLWGLILPDPLRAERIIAGMSSIGLYEFPTEVAREKGFYAEEGLELVKVSMRTDLVTKALLAGDLDYSFMWGSTLRAAVAGMPVRGVMGMYGKPLHMLVGRPGLKRVEDLKGKKIAVSAFGSTPDVLLRATLRHFGLNPEKDVQILSVGGSGIRLAALAAGSVDATPLDLAYVGKSERMGLSTIIYLGDVLNLPLSGVGTSDKKIRENPDQIRRLARATLKAMQFIREKRKEAIRLMVDYLKLTGEDADRIYDFSLRSLSPDGHFSEESLLTDISQARQALKIEKEVPLSQVVDWSFIGRARPRHNP